MVKFSIGDHVEMIDDSLKGTISSIAGNTILVLTEDGFEISVTINDIIKSQEPTSLDITKEESERILKEELSARKKNVRIKPKERSLPKMEIDLHIHQLVPSTKGMSNYDILNVQIETAKRHLEQAIKNRIQKIVFIHGVGEGVLKMELEYLFSRYEAVKYYDADYKKYGFGATEVYIYQNI